MVLCLMGVSCSGNVLFLGKKGLVESSCGVSEFRFGGMSFSLSSRLLSFVFPLFFSGFREFS